MALAANETWRGGFVVNTLTGVPSFTYQSAGATAQGGFMRDPDGRLVISS